MMGVSMDYIVFYCYTMPGQYAARHGQLTIDADHDQAAKDRGRARAFELHPGSIRVVLQSVRQVDA